ncbi:CBN-UBC-21 protein [Caenorhabditis brenneri]|uniref:CBN-UBC-21 protein n=1 Tax=Caenorhabditis brenneri TaxID=135651 RepID=G0MY53_CAEBE|nr:CBN-UBC-21 protein [Caenorhabditis brenneri]
MLEQKCTMILHKKKGERGKRKRRIARGLYGLIKGPEDTPYAGGTFEIQISIPDQYPFEPPKAKFVTRIWHPNISSQTGAICLDILKDKWAASLTLRTVLLSIQAMLCAAEPSDPQDAVVAKQYLSNQAMFKTTATFWTAYFAGSKKEKEPEYVKKVGRIVEMGVREASSFFKVNIKSNTSFRQKQSLC